MPNKNSVFRTFSLGLLLPDEYLYRSRSLSLSRSRSRSYNMTNTIQSICIFGIISICIFITYIYQTFDNIQTLCKTIDFSWHSRFHFLFFSFDSLLPLYSYHKQVNNKKMFFLLCNVFAFLFLFVLFNIYQCF